MGGVLYPPACVGGIYLTEFFFKFFKIIVDIAEQILMFYSMTTLNNKPQYSVITEVDNEQGESRYYVEFFPKSRQGLNDAYKYALSQKLDWTIYFQAEVVDSSDTFDINQVDGDHNLCTQ